MTAKTVQLSERLHAYLLDVSLREPKLLAELRRETATMPEAQMQTAPEQAQFLALLVAAIGAKHAIEIGVFTGYGSARIAAALPPDGRLIACDVSEAYTRIARRYWQRAGLEERIDLRLAPALETLTQLNDDPAERGRFDFVYIDADKEGYVDYYEAVLPLLRTGGLIAADNVLRRGLVADPDNHEPDTEAIRTFNVHVHRDERVDVSMLPIGDGLTIVRKR